MYYAIPWGNTSLNVWVTSHIQMSHVTHINESCHTYDWVTSHMWMSHVNESSQICEWAYIYWSKATHPSFTYLTWLIDMTHPQWVKSNMWTPIYIGSFTYLTWLIDIYIGVRQHIPYSFIHRKCIHEWVMSQIQMSHNVTKTVCCSVLQCVAVCCSVLQCVTV